MCNAEEGKIPTAGITMKPGQYLEEPALLTWTTQKPTAPGLYGYRKSRDGKAYVVDVELENGTLKVDNKNADHCRGAVATIEGEWAGPLLPPK
jgi:hypothetical protein